MPNDMNQGLEDLLNYADDSEREETGQVQTDLDDKSTGSHAQDPSFDQTAEEGVSEGEAETSEEGTEDGGTESEEVSTEEETDPVMQLKAELAAIKEMIQQKGQAEPEEASPPVALPELKPVITDVDLFQGYNFEELMENQDTFKKWAKQLVSKVQEVTQEAIYKNIPQVIQSYTDQQIAVNSQAQRFYQDNPDLAKYKKEVAKNANLIAQAEPGLSQDDFFKKVASFTRMNLNINTQPTTEEVVSGKPKTKPALNKRSAKATTRMTSQPELAGLEKEISDMLSKIDN